MTIENTNVSRRTLVKGAAWSLPVVAVAAATPLAAASTTTASAAWTGGTSTLLDLSVLNTGEPVVGVTVFPTAPTLFRITNTPGVIPNVTAVFSVALDDSLLDLNVGVTDAYLGGFAPDAIPDATKLGTSVISNRKIASGVLGITGDIYAQDTITTFSLGDIASDSAVDFGPITWALAPKKGLALSLGVNTSFRVVVSLQSDGVQFAQLAGSNITSFASAGII